MTSIPNPRPARTDGEYPPLLSVAPLARTSAGVGVPVSVTVTNQAPAARSVQLQALGLDPTWLPSPTVTPLLAPGASHTVVFTVQPPAGTLPAHYPFVVTGQSVDATGAATAKPALAETAVLVNPRAQLRLELVPPSVTAWRTRRMNLRVTNSGSGTAQVRLQPKSTGSVKLRLSEQEIEVPAGATLTVRGRATVLHPQLVGFRMRHVVQVEATGSETAKYAEGEVVQRPALPPIWLKSVAIVAALAVWISAGLVLLPRLTDLLGSERTTIATTGQGGDAGDAGGPGGPGDTGGSGSGGDGSSSGGSGGGASGSGGSGGHVVRAANLPGVQVNGTIKADDPGGVTVLLRRTSLVDEAALGATPVGSATKAAMSSSVGKIRPVSATTTALGRTAGTQRTNSNAVTRQMITAADGVWSFPGVKAPGYYLLTFAKVGFEPRSFVIDSSSGAAAEPLPVDLAPGDGAITGTITNGGRPLGGATVTVSDGVSTFTTQTLSKGKVGTFSVKDLATPGTYVVSATRAGLSLESKVVALKAGGSAPMKLGLRSGVATLTGRISADRQPVGGATVTVTDAAGRAYTSTSATSAAAATPALNDSTAGTYHVPGLPTPGTYTVTVAAEGYQDLTATLSLKAGQSARTRDLEIRSSTGSVVGQVTDTATPPVGLPDAGLVLTNSEHTYKQTSTTAVVNGVSTPGFVEFDGVAPGTYQLTTELWGYTTATTTVVVGAGMTAAIAPKLTYRPVSEILANGRISGSTLDASTGGDISCLSGNALCLTATTADPCPDDQPGCAGGADEDIHSVSFGPGTDFTLPEPGRGLRPGLHTVTISAPGYEAATARIAVPANGTVTLPVARLFAAPTITGQVKIGDQSDPVPNLCVYAVQTGGDAPTACAAPDDPDPTPGCSPTPSRYLGTTTDISRICVIADVAGRYSIQVPRSGSWTLYAIPSAPIYRDSSPITLTVARGETAERDIPVNRLGRATVSLKVADQTAAATAVNATGRTVLTITPLASGADPVAPITSNSSAVATIAGLPAGNYTIAASDADSNELSGTRTITVNDNTARSYTLMLVEKLPRLFGQVTTTLQTGEVQMVNDATAIVTGTYDYNSADEPQTHPREMRSYTDGCFAGRNTLTTTLPFPAECDDSVDWDDRVTAPPAIIDFITPTSSLVKVSATGYAPRDFTNITWGSDPVRFDLTANRMDWAGLRLTVPTSSTPQGLVFSVAGLPGGAAGTTTVPMPGISLSAAGQLGTSTMIGWKDGSNTEDSIAPGSYQLTAKAPGYATATATMTCQINESCGLNEPWEMKKLGSIEVTVTDMSASGSSPIPGATVTVTPCADAACATYAGEPYVRSTDDDGIVLVTGRPSERDGLITDGYDLSAATPAAQYFKVAVEAETYTAPTAKIVTLNTPGATEGASFELQHRPVPVDIRVLDQNQKPVNFATVTMTGPASIPLPATGVDGHYEIDEVAPGNYTITVDAPELSRTTDYYVEVKAGAAKIEHTLYVTRGATRVLGDVKSQTPTVVAIPGAVVTLTCATPVASQHDPSLCPATGPAKGTNGMLLTHTTGPDGHYEFDNVPNGTYAINVSAAGWVTPASPPLVTAQWSLATPVPHNFSLPPVKQNLTVTLDPTASGHNLAAFKATLTPVSTTYGQTTQQNLTVNADGTTSIPNVQFGCYTVTYPPIPGHYGTPVFDSQSAGQDAGLGCEEGEISVSRTPSNPAAATYTLDEAKVSVAVKVGTTWHAAPGNADLTLTTGTGTGTGTTTITVPSVGASPTGVATELWLPAGSWEVNASPVGSGGYTYPAQFWRSFVPLPSDGAVGDCDSQCGDGFSVAAADITVPVVVFEKRATFDVTVPNAAGATFTFTPTGADAPVRVAPPAATTLTATANSSGKASVTLPGGTYSVAVTNVPSGYATPAAATITVDDPDEPDKTLPALAKTTYAVTLSTSSALTPPLSGWSATLTPTSGSAVGPIALGGTGAGDAGNLPWGCWTVTFAGPSPTDGRTLTLTSVSGTGCNGQNRIYIGPTGAGAAITYTVTTPSPTPTPTPTTGG